MNAPLLPPLTAEQIAGMDDMAAAMEREESDRWAEHRAEEQDLFDETEAE